MAQTREITKEDIYFKARMIAEGVRIKGGGKKVPPSDRVGKDIKSQAKAAKDIFKDMDFTATNIMSRFNMATDLTGDNPLSRTVTMDGCGLPLPVYPNIHSRLEMQYDGDEVTITDGGEVLATGRRPKSRDWTSMKLSNGLPITAALPGMSSAIINVLFNYSCNNWNTNKACAYCGLFSNKVSTRLNQLPLNVLQDLAKYQAEAVKIATDVGWKGSLAISGGAFTPSQRPNYLQRLETVLNEMHKALSEEAFSRLVLVYNHYPPEDFKDMEIWKDMGINGTSIDIEVMDPAYFAAICPGKHAYKPLEYWKEAQLASVDVFGPIIGTTGCVVVGIEPMKSLVEGMDERLSKGVMPLPLAFFSDPGSPYAGFRSPSADWLVESAEKMADSFVKYLPKFLPEVMKRRNEMRKLRANLGSKKPSGGGDGLLGNGNQSTHLSIVSDEVQRRVQGMMGGFGKSKK